MVRRIPELDGLRGLAILAVYAGHALKLRMMWIGVDLFFVLSGFLITGILLDADKTSFRRYITGFYERRARRILPALLLTLLTISLCFSFAWLRHGWLLLGLMNYMEVYWREATAHHEFVYDALAPLWSLGVEEQFYLFWPLAVFAVGSRRLQRVVLGLLLLAPVLRALATPLVAHRDFNRYHWFIYRGMPFRMDTLLAGALICLLWRQRPEVIRRYGHLGLIPAFLTPLVMILLSHYDKGFSTVADTVRGNVLTYEVSLFAVSGLLLWSLGTRFAGLLRFRPLRHLGRISYSFYLIHEAALILATQRIAHPAWALLAATAGTLLYAQLSWSLVEEPILKGGSRRRAQQELLAASAHHG